jgi:hypothetical protein
MAASKRDSAIRDVLLAAIGLPFEGWINGVDVQRRHVWKSDWRPAGPPVSRQRARAGRSHRWQVPTGFRTGGAQPGPPVTGPVPMTPRRSSPGRSRFHLHRPPGRRKDVLFAARNSPRGAGPVPSAAPDLRSCQHLCLCDRPAGFAAPVRRLVRALAAGPEPGWTRAPRGAAFEENVLPYLHPPRVPSSAPPMPKAARRGPY